MHIPVSDRLVGTAFVAFSAAAFGSMAIFGVWAQNDGTSTPVLLLVRFAIATAILLLVVHLRRVKMPTLRQCAPVGVMGGFGYVGQAYCYFLALEHADASLVALLLYLFPAFVAVLAAVFLRERIGRATATALTLALVGTGFVVGGGSGHPLGIGLAIGAAVIYSVYITAGSVVTQGLDPVAVSAVVCVAATGVSGLIVVALGLTGQPMSLPATSEGRLSVAAIAALCTVLPILAFFSGLQRLGPTSTAVLSTLEPVVTVSLATWLLDESLTEIQALGGALVLGAIIWLAVSHRPGEAPDISPT